MNFLGEKIKENKMPNNVGVLICNLGTPESYGYLDVRKFLKEFLSDGRVVEIPKFLWWFILNLFILTLRPLKSGKLYKTVWMKEGSPLMVFSKRLVKRLNSNSENNIKYVLAMRYGNPSIEKGLLSLKKKGCDKIIIFPTFPQYSGTTSGSVFDAVTNVLKKWRWVPSLIFINGYHKDAGYVEAIAESLKKQIKIKKPQKIVFSYHGIPKRNMNKGDPYGFFCKETTELVAKKLKLKKEKYITTFQSRFGPDEWLQPYTSDKMEELPKRGIKNIIVLAPGFSADCLETIEEINEENKDIFIEAGGEDFAYIPCLNNSQLHASFIKNIVEKHSSNW
ncbi:MAG: ferrochelatase [Pelagibacterales bacterium]|nr:ferrochelatase [Pelagibacterales bacterium]PPR16643.1 MAG: Ferrochelatase [Alphaproteobacteria bacterium MarineAlpha9_Bin3]|tara:strand:+ start:24138 stop:25142 length:1005 start_codon:yes stop_codon:yes gene_type:complete